MKKSNVLREGMAKLGVYFEFDDNHYQKDPQGHQGSRKPSFSNNRGRTNLNVHHKRAGIFNLLYWWQKEQRTYGVNVGGKNTRRNSAEKEKNLVYGAIRLARAYINY